MWCCWRSSFPLWAGFAVAEQLAAGPDPPRGGADLQPQILAEQVKLMPQIVRVARPRTAMAWGA